MSIAASLPSAVAHEAQTTRALLANLPDDARMPTWPLTTSGQAIVTLRRIAMIRT